MPIFEKAAAYTVVLWVAALLYFYLFVLLLFFPERFLADVGVAGNEAAFFVARRASMLMLGFAVLSFQARTARAPAARQAVTLSIAVNMAGFAILGCREYGRGFANAAILRVAVIECLLTTACFLLWLAARKEEQREMQPTPGRPQPES